MIRSSNIPRLLNNDVYKMMLKVWHDNPSFSFQARSDFCDMLYILAKISAFG